MSTRSPSRRGFAAVLAVLALLFLATVAWKLWPNDTDRTLAADAGAIVVLARDAGATVAIALDAGTEEAADAGTALAIDDTSDAGPDTTEDAGTHGTIEKHPPGKRTGRLHVVTTHEGEPWWASVSIDGVPRGRTPLLLDLPVGKYQLRVERAGFRTQEREIKVAPGKSTVLRIDLVP